MDPVKQTRKHDHSEDDSSCSHESWQEQNFCCPYMNNCPIMLQSMPMEQMPMNQMPMNQMHCCPMPYNEMPYGEAKCNREDDELENETRSPRPEHGDYNHDYHDYHDYDNHYGHYYPPYWYYPRPPYYKRPRPWWMY